MSERQEAENSTSAARLQAPTEAIACFLKHINAARRQISLYGSDHPATEGNVTELAELAEDVLSTHERPTLVFTDTAIVVNDRQFAACSDSIELCQRLRARGVMAITLAGKPSAAQLSEFLLFLNVEPREVQSAGGASSYLRGRQVTRIVATEAVYVGSDGDDEDQPGTGAEAEGLDPIVAAVLEWLSKHDDEEPQPRVPIVQIMSNPDSAAKLIREAVTKLHASRRDSTTDEIAGEVVDDLRTLAAEDASQWDSALPQIRKAISKLPGDTRPTFGGFSRRTDATDARQVDVADIEEMLSTRQAEGIRPEDVGLGDFSDLDKLFGAAPSGQLASWQGELKPESIQMSSARTLETLMTWETNAVEHGRMARALAEMVPAVIESGDLEQAIDIVGKLAREAEQTDGLEWRKTNTVAALSNIDISILRDLVLAAMKTGGYGAKESACVLIRTVPRLALRMTADLLASPDPVLSDSYSRGISQCGADAITELGRCLSTGSPSLQTPALEALIRMGSSQGLHIVVDAAGGRDPVLAVKALAVLGEARSPVSSAACINALSSKAPEVREAALTALGRLEDVDALPHVLRIATKTSVWRDNTLERIAAIRALGHYQQPEAVRCLEVLAQRRGTLRRSQTGAVRSEAEKALAEARRLETAAFQKAA